MASATFCVIPAVDLLGDDAVRLEQGDFGRVAARARPLKLIRRFAEAGARLIHLVDLGGARIERDGMLAGPDLELLREVREAWGLPVLAAGGISSEADVAAVAASGCEGAVVGRALLDGSLPLSAVG